MATFCFLPFPPEVFDCVLHMICFLRMDSFIIFLSYVVFAEASHVSLTIVTRITILFTMTKVIEYVFDFLKETPVPIKFLVQCSRNRQGARDACL